MKNFPLIFPNSFLKILVLSCLIHIIVLNVFTFSFPVTIPTQRPSLIFIGSILYRQDIHELNLENRKTKGVKTPDALVPSSQRDQFDSSTTVYKPSFSDQILRHKKKYLKSFYVDVTPAPQKTDPASEQILGVAPQAPSYKPLTSDIK